MKTSATNRKIRVLLTAIRDGSLIPQPEFQRRLVWSNRHKRNFLTTVLEGLPFPEIYVAAGQVDPQTGEGKELLVDWQQRITTLHQYFLGSPRSLARRTYAVRQAARGRADRLPGVRGRRSVPGPSTSKPSARSSRGSTPPSTPSMPWSSTTPGMTAS